MGWGKEGDHWTEGGCGPRRGGGGHGCVATVGFPCVHTVSGSLELCNLHSACVNHFIEMNVWVLAEKRWKWKIYWSAWNEILHICVEIFR